MWLQIDLDAGLVHELDRRFGPRGRGAFIERALRSALHDERRWDSIDRALGSIDGSQHDWDDDPGAWVREQRRADPNSIG